LQFSTNQVAKVSSKQLTMTPIPRKWEMDEKPKAAWILGQCSLFGKLTLGRDKINEIFEEDGQLWTNINKFCKENKLSLTFDADEKIFTFEKSRF
jgi:hypothetical protein